uniref:Uncharacterized protein n=1 Tax=Arundo donax TaxID=35708 RepID=A0A0A9EJQ1_ARUDO
MAATHLASPRQLAAAAGA